MSALVPCLVCGGKFKTITNSHLRKHDLTPEEYREIFPDASLVSAEVLEKMSDAGKRFWKENPISQSDEYRKKLSEGIKKARKNSESSWLFEKVCASCGHTFISRSPQPKQVRCPDCQAGYERARCMKRLREKRKLYKKLVKEHRDAIEYEDGELLGHTFPMPSDGRLGTRGTPQMNLGVLSNGRVYATAWLERDYKSLKSGFAGTLEGGFPKRKRLPKMGWQRRIMDRCPACGSHGIMVWQENPHCFECDSEIVLARENRYYSAQEFCCCECGVIDNSFHYVFRCEKCEGEYRVRIGDSGKTEVR